MSSQLSKTGHALMSLRPKTQTTGKKFSNTGTSSHSSESHSHVAAHSPALSV